MHQSLCQTHTHTYTRMAFTNHNYCKSHKSFILTVLKNPSICHLKCYVIRDALGNKSTLLWLNCVHTNYCSRLVFFFIFVLPSKGEQTFANPGATALIMASFLWVLLDFVISKAIRSKRRLHNIFVLLESLNFTLKFKDKRRSGHIFETQWSHFSYSYFLSLSKLRPVQTKPSTHHPQRELFQPTKHHQFQ